MPCSRVFTGLCSTSNLEIGWGVRETDHCDDRSSPRQPLTAGWEAGVDKEPYRDRGGALDAQAALPDEWADRERKLDALAAAVLTALAERVPVAAARRRSSGRSEQTRPMSGRPGQARRGFA
jgi:hypothetical protein